MADIKNKNSKKANSLIQNIQSGISGLYANTYFTQDTNKKDLNNIKNDIDKSIDDIINNNITNSGVPNISRLYTRLHQDNNDNTSGLGKDLEDMFSDKAMTDAMMQNFLENKYIRDFDEEIDTICKYMPTLEDALDAKKDNVLSADHFTKDFINPINTSNVGSLSTFNERMKQIKEKYNLVELFEEMYDNTSRYGEQFLYIVPYSKAMDRLLKNKNSAVNTVSTESSIVENGYITESINYNELVIESGIEQQEETNGGLNLKLDVTGVLESAVSQHNTIKRIITESTSRFTTTLKSKNITFEGLESKTSKGADGLVDTNNIKENIKLTVPGCVVKKLKRENVIPVYIEDLCLGYYYLEYKNNTDVFQSETLNDPIMSLKSGKLKMTGVDNNRDILLQQLSSKIATTIDSKFINANQDLRKEIYMVLKHNDMFKTQGSASELKVTFIPPDDMIHMTFKKDPITHRGISDLEKSLLPAKLYISLYMSNYLGTMTRAQDKRVYYVNQTVDTNISKTLLNTINQIKKGNFGQRELTSVKNLLNLTGRFNDFIIPMSSSGDSPIKFEIMPGQQIDPQTELLEAFEQMAINSTDVPYEYIQSRKTVDYAVRLTMSNGKFLRKSFKRQARCEIFLGEILTKLYNTEFEENDKIEAELPPPAFLNLLNTNNMTNNINENVQNILEMEMADEQDEAIKASFSRKLKRHYLSGYLDLKNIERLKEEAKMEVAVKKKNEE